MTGRTIARPTVADRRARGKQARDRTPLSSHRRWTPAADRPDPVALLQDQDATREPDLVPVRHGRMLVSPFTFYRGAAKIMAADLAGDVGMCTCRTSGRSARPNAACCSTSTTSTRPSRVRSSTTSSGWRPASPSPAATTASPRPTPRRPRWPRWRPTGRPWPASPPWARWPPLDQETQQLIVRLARENPTWGDQRIKGELQHLGVRVSATAIRATLRRHGRNPAPRRADATWRAFLRQQAAGIVACERRVLGLAVDRRPQPPGAGPPGLRPALQRPPTPPGAGACSARSTRRADRRR
jgi:Uncharacterized protein conserved in bacteria (DUF2252)